MKQEIMWCYSITLGENLNFGIEQHNNPNATLHSFHQCKHMCNHMRLKILLKSVGVECFDHESSLLDWKDENSQLKQKAHPLLVRF